MTALVSPPVQQADRPQNSRRGFLRILAALAPAAGLAGVPISAVALAQGPDEDPALLAIGRRAAELDRQWEIANQAVIKTSQTFYDLAPPFPKEVFVEPSDAVVTPGTEHHYVFDIHWLRSLVAERPARSRSGRAIRRKLKIVEAHEARLEALRKATGIRETLKRLATVDAEIEQLAEDAFACAPRTRAGLLALAQTFMVRHGPNDDDHRALCLQAARPLALAEAVIRMFGGPPDAHALNGGEKA